MSRPLRRAAPAAAALALLPAALVACAAESSSVDAGPGARDLAPGALAPDPGHPPVADARVEEAMPVTNYGGSPRLVADGAPRTRSYLRFEVPDDPDRPTITGARLRLFVDSATADGPDVRRAAGPWREDAITWADQPGPSGPPVADAGPMPAGAWYELDVTPLVDDDGVVDLVLTSEVDDGVELGAREGRHPPRLIVSRRTTTSVHAVLEADGDVVPSGPGTRLGAAPTIGADQAPPRESFLRFRLAGITTPIVRARLRLAVTNASDVPPVLHRADAGWAEGELTWSARPAIGEPVAEAAPAPAGGELVYDVTDAVTGDGELGFALVAASSDGFAASSKEGTRAPELVVTVDGTPPTSFAFGAAGDHGAGPETSAVLDLVPAHGDFFLSLGDLSYGLLAPETTWCAYVEDHVGVGYPFAILAGNHEADHWSGGGVIDAFVAPDCLPNRLPGVVGDYGKQYHVDVPAAAPLARVIALSPGLDFASGGRFDYAPGSPRHAWTAAAIDDARARGIPWVIVATHANCLTTGLKGCEMGRGLFDLLVDRRVDLVLQGHDHTYQRSKQLAHGPGCGAIAVGGYDPDCVADGGEDGIYARGAGTVVVINGMGGAGPYEIAPGDAEAGYFARVMTSPSYGLVSIAGTAGRLEVEFVPATGDFTDHFVIGAP